MGKRTRTANDVLVLGEDTEREFKKHIKAVDGEVRKSWPRDLWWVNSLGWKREALSDAEKYHQPYHYQCEEGTQISVYQAPPDYKNGSWGCTVTDPSIMLAKYIEHDEQHSPGRYRGVRALELSSEAGLCGLVLAQLQAAVTISTQEQVKLATLQRSSAKASSPAEQVSWLPYKLVAADADLNASLPYSLIVCTDQFMMYDSELVKLLVTALSRLSGSDTRVLLAYGRNCSAAEEFEQLCEGLFSVRHIPPAEHHPSYVGAPGDIAAIELTRAAPIQRIDGGEVVPASPHLSAVVSPRLGPSSPGLPPSALSTQGGDGVVVAPLRAARREALFNQLVLMHGTRRRDRYMFAKLLGWFYPKYVRAKP